GIRIDSDDQRRTLQSCTRRGAEADGTFCKYGNGVAELKVRRFTSRYTCGSNVGQQNDVFVCQRIGYLGKVRLCIGNKHEFGLAPIDCVTEFPSAQAAAALRPLSRKTEFALTTRRNGSDQDTLACLVPRDSRT